VPVPRWTVALAALVIAALLPTAGAGRPADAPIAPTTGCYGAAARDPALPQCRAAAAQPWVRPDPAQAAALPNSPCDELPLEAGLRVCTFGAPAAAASRTIALVGDSHAGHWRAALTAVAAAKGWHAFSITHSSCPLQKALRDLPEPKRTSCRLWKHRVLAWFTRHPEVRTVFVAGLTGGSGVVPEPRRSAFATSTRGYERAWQALPETVRHIVVIRDTPKFRARTNRCVARAVAHGVASGPACARPRREALDPDPAMTAASSLNSPRVQAIDLTQFFCDARRCHPVVGGALVLRDNTHMTGTFSATLGPYLLQAVNRLSLG